MSRYRDSGNSDCKLYVGDLGEFIFILLIIFKLYMVHIFGMHVVLMVYVIMAG
jgi:hypothetical protein